MYKFRDSFYKELKDYAQANLGGLGIVKSVPDRNQYFTTFIKKLKLGIKQEGSQEHQRLEGRTQQDIRRKSERR